MNFKHTWQRALAGDQTEFRQFKNPRCAPGQTCAVQPGHAQKSIASIVVKSVYRQRLATVSDADARAEGFDDRRAYFAHLHAAEGFTDMSRVAWVVGFELADSDPQELGRQINSAKQSSATEPGLRNGPPQDGRYDFLHAAALHNWFHDRIEAGWILDDGYRPSPLSLCRGRDHVPSALYHRDLPDAYRMMRDFQQAVCDEYQHAGFWTQSQAFQSSWWPQRCEALVWPAPPASSCPRHPSGREFWLLDHHGYVCRECLPVVRFKPLETFNLDKQGGETAVPGKVVWHHQLGDSLTWSVQTYQSYLDEATAVSIVRSQHDPTMAG